MSYLGSYKIDDYLTFCCNTHDPDTGVATDADSVPTYRVYEDETATPILTGSTALLDSANTAGFYSERIQLTAANGLEKGKCYTIYISATVDSDVGTMHHTFQIEAEVDCNTASDLHADLDDGGRLDLLIDAIKAVTDLLPNAGALSDLATILADTNELQTDDVPGLIAALNDPTAAAIRTEMDSNSTQLAAIVADTNELQTDDVPGLIIALNDPTAAAIADAVWDEASTGHVDAGKAGEQLWTDVDAILADTNELQTDDIPGAISGLNDPTAAAIRTEMDSNSTQLAAIVADTNELQTDDVPGLIAGLNDVSTAEVNTEVDTALADIHLDHLLAADYDPASKPGVAMALLNELVESDAGVSRFTANALEEAPTGGSVPTVEEIRTEMDDNSTQLAAIVADTNELQTDDVPGLIAGLNDLSAAEVNAEVDTALADYDPPTKAEMDAGFAGLDDPTAADVWGYATRTLTQSAAAVTAAVSGSDITVLRGDTFVAALTGLGSLSGYVSLDFTVKERKADGDLAAIVRIRKNASGVDDGLLRINGGAAGDASKGSIAIDDEGAGDITITLAADVTDDLETRGGLYYDVQMITSTSVETLTEGGAAVTADVTRAVA